MVFGLLYKLLWGAVVLVDIDDEELLFVGEREPITLDGLKRLCHGLPEPRELMGPLWTRLAVGLAQWSDGIFEVTPLAASMVRSLPRESGPEMPGTLNTNSDPHELQTGVNTALSWSAHSASGSDRQDR